MTMSLNSHLQELRKKHETLAAEVEDAQRTPGYDEVQVTALKRKKLQLKEEIRRLSAS